MPKSTYQLIVQFGDCDPAGIVFYPHFYRWFDAATHHLLNEAGLGWDALRRDYGVVGIPLLETGAKYQAPARFGDQLRIESSVVELGRKTLRLQHLVKRGGDLLVEGFELRVFSVPHAQDAARQSALELSAEMRRALA